MTDTAVIADIILPAKDMFEQSDIISSYWSPYIQFKPKVIQSPGEVMPESEIYYYLAEKLDLKVSKMVIPEPGNRNIEKWLESRIKGYSGLKLNDLKNGPVLAPGLQQIAFGDLKFETLSGKIELYSAEASTRWGCSPLPDYVPCSQSEGEELFPLVFITANTGSRLHSQFGNLNIIRDTVEGPVVAISVGDAVKRNISSGDTIRIFNKAGEIFSKAGITNRIPEGIISLPNGIWNNEGGGGNHLIEGKETDMGYGSAFHDNRVEVERVY
jgi:anaerobic selenocysteine-containing dehydrogenase